MRIDFKMRSRGSFMEEGETKDQRILGDADNWATRQNSMEKENNTDALPDYADNSKENISTTMACRLTARTTRRKKYFDYFVFKIVDCGYHARGLVVAHSRKLSATLGGSTSTRPGVWKITLQTCDFIDISNAMIPTALGGSTTTSPLIVIVILRQ
jgi:hypothetical protein